MIKAKKLILNNFLTYKDQIFDFDEMFKKSNILLISGNNVDDNSFANDNGAGKSIIYKALLFAAFNRTPENTEKNRLIGKHSKSMSVAYSFEDSYGNNYWIKRYRKHRVYGNDLRLKINGKEIKKGTQTELTNLMLRSLGISYKRVMNTSIFESNDERSRFVYLGDKDAKSLLSQIKGTDIFIKCYELVQEKQNASKKDMVKKEEVIEKLTWKLESAVKEADKFKKLSDDFEKEKEKGLMECRETIKTNEKETDNKIKYLQNEIDASIEKITEYEKQLKSEDLTEQMSEEIHDLEKVISVLNKKFDLSTHETKRMEKVISSTVNLQEDFRCELCGNIITKKIKDEHIKELRKEIAIHENKIQKVQSKLDKLSPKHFKLLAELSEIFKENRIIKDKMANQDGIIKDKTYIMKSSKRELDNYVALMNKHILKLTSEANNYSTSLAQYNKSIKVYKQKIRAKGKRLEALRDKYKYLTAWATGFGREEIQSFALRSTIEELNTKIQYISDILTDGLVDIELLTEKTLKNKSVKSIFELSIKGFGKKGLPFTDWNKGNQRRVEIIMSFALMNLEENIMQEVWLDELFDGIDRVGIGKILNLLNKETENGKRFIVMSHSNNIKSMFTNKGVVTLKDGISVFELQ